MIFREYLVMRKALLWFTSLLVGMVLIGEISGVVHIGPNQIDFPGIAAASGWLAAIFASIFGVALGNGSREPAPILWLIPSDRWKVALKIIGVDMVGTTVAYASAFLIIIAFVLPATHFNTTILGSFSTQQILEALTLAYAAYGWSALLGILARRMAYSGLFSLPLLMLWMLLAQSNASTGAILRPTLALNPFAIFAAGQILSNIKNTQVILDPTTLSLSWLGTGLEIPILITIAVATCFLAVAIWQRAETI